MLQISVLYRGPYQRFIVHIKLTYKTFAKENDKNDWAGKRYGEKLKAEAVIREE